MNEHLWRELVDKLPHGLAVWKLAHPGEDESLELAYSNRAFELLTGLELASKRGQLLVELFPLATSDRIRLIADTCREGGQRPLLPFAYPAAELVEDMLSGQGSRSANGTRWSWWRAWPSRSATNERRAS